MGADDFEPAPLERGRPARDCERPVSGLPPPPSSGRRYERRPSESLRSRGVDPSTIDLDALLDPEEVARIARRFIGAFTVRTHLDRYDLAIMLVAGLTAALVDWLVVNGAPTSLEQLREFRPDKEGLTSLLQGLTHVDSDNWLGDLSHASFDQQRSADGSTLPGFTPQTHRDLSLGHDPLLALIVGVRDVMNGSMTTQGGLGAFRTLAGSQLPVSDPYLAVMIVVAHLLSDAFTPMGLPAPGWTLVDTLQFGSFDTDGITAAAEA